MLCIAVYVAIVCRLQTGTVSSACEQLPGVLRASVLWLYICSTVLAVEPLKRGSSLKGFHWAPEKLNFLCVVTVWNQTFHTPFYWRIGLNFLQIWNLALSSSGKVYEMSDFIWWWHIGNLAFRPVFCPRWLEVGYSNLIIYRVHFHIALAVNDNNVYGPLYTVTQWNLS